MKRVLYGIESMRVLQWQDTEAYSYSDPAIGMAFLEVTQSQWDNQDGLMWVAEGALTDVEPVIESPGLTNEELASSARYQREQLLRNFCDPGILMAQRSLRMASSPEEIAYAEGKISEIDIYAQALIDLPDQSGFPQTIIWPVAPTK